MNVDVDFTLQRGDFSLAVGLQVSAGETLALLGPNGAGKSTTLRVLAGLHAVASGHVRLGDQLVDDGAGAGFVPPERRGVGFVFQDHLLFGHLTARDNVAYGLRSRGVKARLARTVADDWLQRVGLGARGDARPGELSGGEAQRVALARALAVKPQLLLLDEPLAAADASARLELRRTLQTQLREFSGACVLVAHDLGDALALADKVAVLESGRVVQQGRLAELGHRPASRYVADLVGLNCFRGVCEGNALRLAGGAELFVGTPHDGAVIATLHPRAVALFRERPAGSPRNVWCAPVLGLERAVDCVRVRLGGDVPVIAEVTEAAVRDLELDGGGSVWAAIKATEFRVAPA